MLVGAADRLGPGRATRIALTLSAVGLTVVGLWRVPAGLIVGAVVLGAGLGFVVATRLGRTRPAGELPQPA